MNRFSNIFAAHFRTKRILNNICMMVFHCVMIHLKHPSKRCRKGSNFGVKTQRMHNLLEEFKILRFLRNGISLLEIEQLLSIYMEARCGFYFYLKLPC